MIQDVTNLLKAIKTIFPNGIPSIAKWTDHKEIIDVLNAIGSFKNSNHLFYPDNGGLDLKGASPSLEPNCIEIKTSFNEILSPSSLTFHSFQNDDNFDWAFFRLQTNEIPQTDTYDDNLDYTEGLTEIAPLQYVDRSHWDYNDYQDEPLPKNARLIIRRLKGSFVIFGKTSPYNRQTSTYDARHENYSEQEFSSYIEMVRKNGWDN